jgi:hypothetical protein
MIPAAEFAPAWRRRFTVGPRWFQARRARRDGDDLGVVRRPVRTPTLAIVGIVHATDVLTFDFRRR